LTAAVFAALAAIFGLAAFLRDAEEDFFEAALAGITIPYAVAV
jgi:hypothetical protein